MAHFSKVLNGKVIDVIVAEQEFIDNFVDTSPGEWIKTSYNMKGGKYIDPDTRLPVEDQSISDGDEARERKNFGSVGFLYDSDRDAFIPEKPFDSWTLNETTCLYDAPIPRPDEDGIWLWDEDAYQADNTTGWVEEE